MEDQCSDRVYRIGQTKPVFIQTFVTKNTLEEDILSISKSRLGAAGAAAGGDADDEGAGGARRRTTQESLKFDELKLLFQRNKA